MMKYLRIPEDLTIADIDIIISCMEYRIQLLKTEKYMYDRLKEDKELTYIIRLNNKIHYMQEIVHKFYAAIGKKEIIWSGK